MGHNRKRAQGMVSNELLITILVVLLLASILMFVFKADLLSKIKFLPTYDTGESKEIDLSGYTPDQLSKLGFNCEAIGDKKIAVLYSVGDALYQVAVGDLRRVYLFSEDGDKLIKLDVFFDTDERNNYLLKVIGGFDVTIGRFIDKRLTIDREFFKEESSSYLKIKPYLSTEMLKRLEGSFLSSFRVLCKSEADLELESKEGSVFKQGYCSLISRNEHSHHWFQRRNKEKT